MYLGRVIVRGRASDHDEPSVPAALARYRNEVYEAPVAHLGGDGRGGRLFRPRGIGQRRERAPALMRSEVVSVQTVGRPRRVLRLPEPRLREWEDRLDAD